MFAVKGTGEGCSCEVHAVCISETERRCVEDLKSRAEFVGTPLYPVLIWNLNVNLDSRDTSSTGVITWELAQAHDIARTLVIDT